MATTFQEQVWNKLQEIPQGKVTTYREVARAIGSPKAMRAVGSACAANPRLIAVPCHRVIRSDGGIGEYAGGKQAKIDLLTTEGIAISEANRVEHLSSYLYRFR